MEASYAVIEAADAAVASAREARRAVNERFQAGVATSTLVLDADVALLQAELDRTRAVAQARIDEADLQRTLGELPPTGAVAAAASSRGDAAP